MKKLNNKILFILLFFISLYSKSQNTNNLDSLCSSKYLNISANYYYSSIGKISSGSRGLAISIGFNFAKFFSNSQMISVFIEVKPVSGFINHNFTKKFISDFNNSVTLNNNDSLAAQSLFKSLNGYNSYSHYGNTAFLYGITYCPSLYKYSGFGLTLKKGFISYRFNNSSFLGQDAPDNAYVSMPINYCFEMTIKPLINFSKIRNSLNNSLLGMVLLNVRFGIFYEELNWKQAKFEGTQLKSFLTDEFISKYKSDRHFGISLKFCYE